MALKEIFSRPERERDRERREQFGGKWFRGKETRSCSFLHYQKRFKEVVISADISAKDFTKESGLEILIKKIKYAYIKKDINVLAFMAYDKFETFKRPDDISIVDYSNEFERLNNRIWYFDIALPTGILAYKILKNANMSVQKQQLIRATVPSIIDLWKYEKLAKSNLKLSLQQVELLVNFPCQIPL